MPSTPPVAETQKKPPPSPAKAAAKPEAAQAKGGQTQAIGKQPASANPAGGQAAAAANARVDRMAVHAKLAVSQPGDAVEREADQVADKVMRAIDANRHGEPRTASARPDAPSISRASDDTSISRAPEDATETNPAQPHVPRDFARSLGTGVPLDAGTRSAFESQFDHDFSRVRVHDDAAADAAARQIGARAFTLGDHVAFAGGQYDPTSPEGRRLLAHELTHVVQQADGVTRMVMRVPTGGGGGGGATGAPEFIVTAPLQVPPIKSRHATTYAAKATQKVLRRPAAYNSATRGTGQVPIWLDGADPDPSKIPSAFHPAAGSTWSLPLQQQSGAALVGGANLTAKDNDELKEKLKRPTWDKAGNTKEMQVDHMVEFQLGGHDAMGNFELLDQASNGSIGSSFNHEINRSIRTELETHPAALPPAPGVSPMPSPPDVNFRQGALRHRLRDRGGPWPRIPPQGRRCRLLEPGGGEQCGTGHRAAAWRGAGRPGRHREACLAAVADRRAADQQAAGRRRGAPRASGRGGRHRRLPHRGRDAGQRHRQHRRGDARRQRRGG